MQQRGECSGGLARLINLFDSTIVSMLTGNASRFLFRLRLLSHAYKICSLYKGSYSWYIRIFFKNSCGLVRNESDSAVWAKYFVNGTWQNMVVGTEVLVFSGVVGRAIWCWINFSSGPERPTNMDNSRARTYCACKRCGWGVWTLSSCLPYIFSSFLTLGDGSI